MAIIQWQVTSAEAGTRLDVFLSQHVTGLSRSAAARALRRGAVQVVGKKNIKPGLILQIADQVLFEECPLIPAVAEPEAMPLSIVYQDNDVAVINKPAGLVTHPAAGHYAGTLVNVLLHHLKNLSGIGGVLRPGIVHRLDKETSGLMLVAKNDLAHQVLTKSIQKREVVREYDALVWGHIQEKTFLIETQIGRDPHNRKRFTVVCSGGKHAVTQLRVVRQFYEFSLLRVKLETGRTHQIRVHCRYLGTPVVGDRTYGKRGETGRLLKLGLMRPDRQLLHATYLSFSHPVSGKVLSFQVPWPDDFKTFVASLESDGN